MQAALLTMLFLAPCEAPKPAAVGSCVRVDIIVINRHRQVREWDELNWRNYVVRKREFTETWWVSFWDVKVVSLPPFGPIFVDLVDRGWWPMGDVRSVAPCTEGFSVEKKGRAGLVVIGTELRVIDSPFDWEVKHRRFYRPIKHGR